jgi:CrcB protein
MMILLIAVLGGLGAASRLVVDGMIRTRWPRTFPVATLVVNVSGSLLIGLLVGAQLHHGFGPWWFAAATVGFCGGYTTFSTAMAETVRLVQDGELWRATLNAVGSLILCVAAAALGMFVMAL